MLVMAVHKVPQDVEADDKFLGPLSFKQFLFFGGAGIGAYLTFITITKVWPVSIVLALPTLFFGALAFPWSKEQPTELFLASRIRFLIKPRKRIWNQSGVKDLVNITVPIREAHIYSDGLSQGEVRNRLSALATMVDSRGWAVKNIHNTFANDDISDRLVEAPAKLDEKATIVDATPDVFDDSAGTIARQFDNMIKMSDQERKSATIKLVEEARRRSSQTNQQSSANTSQSDLAAIRTMLPPAASQDTGNEQAQDFWFMHTANQPADPSLATFQPNPVINPGQSPAPAQSQLTEDSSITSLSEQQLLEAVQEKRRRDAMQTTSKYEKVINPYGTPEPSPIPNPSSIPSPQSPVPTQATSTMTPTPNPDILSLSRSNDLSVETLARQANKKKILGDDEVVISLR